MQKFLVRALQARRPHIRAHWEILLRGEPVNSPLAQAEMMIRLIDWSLDEVFALLQGSRARRAHRPSAPLLAGRAACQCGRNPLLAHFIAGEQAMLEALVLAQAATRALDPAARDTSVAELYRAVRTLAHREVDAFCSLCQHRAISGRTPAGVKRGRFSSAAPRADVPDTPTAPRPRCGGIPG